jgi:hypothetical protein
VSIAMAQPCCSFTMAGEEDGTNSFGAFTMEDDRDRSEHDPDIASVGSLTHALAYAQRILATEGLFFATRSYR